MSSTESTQTTVRIESIPQTWDAETDIAFFTIVARLFTADFTYGAGVLLATFDNSDADQVGPAVDTTFADRGVAASAHRQPSSELVPVAVRRHH